MSKYKLISLITGAVIVTGVAMGAGTLSHKIINNSSKMSNTILLAQVSNNTDKAVVINTNKSPLVLYKGADSNASVLSYISVGEMLNVQSEGSDFYKVQVEETGATGYISVNNLQMITSGVNDAYTSIGKKGIVINVDSKVHLRANATINSSILIDLKNSTSINILGKQGSWYKVSVEGTIGYLYQSYVGESNVATATTNTTSNSLNKATTISNSKDAKSNTSTSSAKLNDSKVSSKLMGTPLSSSQLSKFIGTWTVGKSVAYLGGGTAYGSDGIKNIPGKQFTINENSINYFGDTSNISDYYITKQNTLDGAYGNPGIVSDVKGANPLNIDKDGNVMLLSAVSGKTPTVADLNDGSKTSFIVSGNNLIVDDAGSFFVATKDSSTGAIKDNNVKVSTNIGKVADSNNNSSTANNKQQNLGEQFIKLGNEAYTLGVPANTLRETVYNAIKNKIPNSGIIMLTPAEGNIVLQGSKAEKDSLIKKLGGNKLLVNVTYNNNIPTNTTSKISPQSYNNANKEFYYNFLATTLSKICESPNNWGTYSGQITKSGNLLSVNEYNKLAREHQIYLLNLQGQTPCYPEVGQINIG